MYIINTYNSLQRRTRPVLIRLKSMSDKIKIGVSTCLLGMQVRYDGTHQLDRFLTETLGKYVEYVPVCPEVDCGMPTPREPMRLVGDIDNPRLITTQTQRDLTDQMVQWGKQKLRDLEKEELCGFIFKSKSPSSGMERVKVYNTKGMSVKKGVGIWARMFMEHFPLLPVEEDGRLNDPGLRENFIERLFVFQRWRTLEKDGRTRGNLVKFHTQHKLLLMSHSPALLRDLGKLTAEGKRLQTDKLFNLYLVLLSKTLRLRATVKKHTNVLQHVMGYFKNIISPDEKQELLEIIRSYKAEHVPLLVPITLLNHYVRKYNESYLKLQHYLNPHPLELKLRNHV